MMTATVHRVYLAFLLCGGWTCSSSADDAAYRRELAKAVRAAAVHVLPSVVTIEIIGTSGAAKGEVEQDAPTSAVIVDSDGYILASSIVVRRPAASILVVLPDGTRHTARIVARDQHRDLVLLKIQAKQALDPIELQHSAELRVGQTTVAVGRYGGESAPMISTGILSASGRLDGIALQTDARVSPALYGGPLVDLYGNVLGLLIPAVAEGGAEDATSWYDSGIAFAVPSSVILKKLDRLKAGDDIQKGLIGIVPKSKDPNDEGTEIAAVRLRSPAEVAGIKAGDTVLSIDDTPVRRYQEIRQVLGSFDAGESVTVRVEREGQAIDVEVVLAGNIPPLQPQRLGIVVREEAIEGEEKKTNVVVAALLPQSAADGDLEVGDVLVRLGETQIDASESLRRQMITAEPGREIEISFRRNAKQTTTTIMPESIAGELPKLLPEAWAESTNKPWTVEEIKLPDAANAAAFVAPTDAGPSESLGLLLLLLEPGGDVPKETLGRWQDPARNAGVVVCAVASEDEKRWQPKELETIGKFAAAVLKKAPIDPSAVAVAAVGALGTGKATAADSMAFAVAISQSKTFFGLAVSSETRPPAVRLRENEPSASLQILLPEATKEGLPSWAGTIEKSGYPIVLGGKVDEAALLRWVRLLQMI